MDEVEVDRQPVQRGEARLAVGRDRLRAPVRHPARRPRPSRPSSRSARAPIPPQRRRGARATSSSLPCVRARRVEDGHHPPRRPRRPSRTRTRPAGAYSRGRREAPSGRARSCRGMQQRHGAAPTGAENVDQRRRRDQRRPRRPVAAGARHSRTGSSAAARGRARARLVRARARTRRREGPPASPVQPPSARRVEPFGVQALVDLVGPRADERHETVVVLAAAESTRPVAGGERRRLVEEEQLREPAGLKQPRPLPVLELEPAGDPALDGEAAPDPAGPRREGSRGFRRRDRGRGPRPARRAA